MTTNYRRGATFELRVRDKLRALGYYANRSPRSGGLVDVYAYKRGDGLLVSCKRDGRLPLEEAERLRAYAESVGATPIFAEPAKRTGKRRSGIRLWVLGAGSFPIERRGDLRRTAYDP